MAQTPTKTTSIKPCAFGQINFISGTTEFIHHIPASKKITKKEFRIFGKKFHNLEAKPKAEGGMKAGKSCAILKEYTIINTIQ